MRPGASVSGTRCTRCTPDSNLSWANTPRPFDLGDDFLVAAHVAFAAPTNLDLPAVLGGVALVHAEQIAREQGRFVAAGAGPDFQDDVALIHRILRDEGEPDFMCERLAPCRQRRLFGLGERAHLGIGRSVGQHRVEIGNLALDALKGLDRLDDRLKFGELA